ncbi:antiviral reverse transcriptase Drt3b [Pistricoccus aurantiacus]|uniref:antiviral reverse transcriptase Drt3b n=1 Tax=Pistricoccus aurantiacus TaxID=1883414 RepID=UPI0036423FD8
MSKTRKIKLDKKDFMRAVLTDTLPSDVPIIFSNDGYYINHHKVIGKECSSFNIVRSLYLNLIAPSENTAIKKEEAFQKQNQQSYPMKYKIIKNENSLRTLSLIHPRAQKNYCDVYKDFANAIVYLCGISSYSIRRPFKVGSSFYDKDEKITNKYKEINIETLEDDLKRKHASSFFSYGGYDRLYKFFSSARYFDLEKRFSQMWFMDVANCFDTIYTHTVSWAIKHKEYVKKYVNHSNQFCQRIDTVMQRSNNNETNGIPVGAEFSRVFAEIIFQDIDHKVEKSLQKKYGLYFGSSYEIVRYVDDYVIFAKSTDVAKRVYNEIEDNLSLYNLYLNEKKIDKHERPFFTYKSRVVVGVNDAVSDLQQSLFTQKSKPDRRIIYPNKINRSDKFEQKFINKIKIMMGNEGVEYSEVSPYIIGVIYKRILRLVENYKNYSQEEKVDSDLGLKVRDAFLILIRLVFFFYSVSPSVSASEKVARTIVVIDQFSNRNLKRHVAAYRSVVMSNVEKLKFDREKNDDRNGYISLERLNIIIATSGFGDNYTIPKDKLSFSKADPEDVTYFDIVCLLYYFQDRDEYVSERDEIIEFAINRIYKKGFNLEKDSESIYLFLDLLCCPFVDDFTKKKMLSDYLKKFESKLDADAFNFEVLLEQLSQTYWFVKWKDVDLIKSLERKALKRPY